MFEKAHVDFEDYQTLICNVLKRYALVFSNKNHNLKIHIVFLKLVLHTTQFKVSIDLKIFVKSGIAYSNCTSNIKCTKTTCAYVFTHIQLLSNTVFL